MISVIEVLFFAIVYPRTKVSPELSFLSSIKKLIGQPIKLSDVPGFEPAIWSEKAPTASEVQKDAAARKKTARQEHGSRRQSTAKTSTRERNAMGNKPGRRRNQKRKFSGGKG